MSRVLGRCCVFMLLATVWASTESLATSCNWGPASSGLLSEEQEDLHWRCKLLAAHCASAVHLRVCSWHAALSA